MSRMKKPGVTVSLALAAAAIALAAAAARADYVSAVLADDPRWYLRFDETLTNVPAADAANAAPAPQSGAQDGDYDAFIGGGDTVPALGVTGIPGLATSGNTAMSLTAANLNTAAPNAQARNADPVHPTAYSIEVWVKPSVIRGQSIVYQTDGNVLTTYSHMIGMTATGAFENYLFDGGVKFIGGDTPAFYTNLNGPTFAEADQWYHVVATAINGGAMQLYVNGALEAQYNGPLATLWTGGLDWRIAAVSGRGTWYAGSMDELALFDRVLTNAEVVEHFLLGSGNKLAVTPFNSAADLDISGGPVAYAVNVSSDAVVRTVNGVGFSPTDALGGVPGVTVASNSLANNWGTVPNFGASSSDDALEQIMWDIRWGSNGNVNIDAAVEAGREYKLTLLFAENFLTTAGARVFDVFIEGVLLLDEFDVFAAAGGQSMGVAVTYQFFAYDNNLDIDLLLGSTPGLDHNPILNGFYLIAIPTPAALPAGLGLLALGATRRRRRN